jgi:hypothetical protein
MGIILIRNDRFARSSTTVSAVDQFSPITAGRNTPTTRFSDVDRPVRVYFHIVSHHIRVKIFSVANRSSSNDDVTDADDAPSDKRERVARLVFLLFHPTGIIYPKKGGSVYPLGQSFSRRVLLLVGVCQSASLQGARIVGAEIERVVEKMSCRTTTTRHGTNNPKNKIKTVGINIYIRRERGRIIIR